MPRCQIITGAGVRCRNYARWNDHRCGLHIYQQTNPRCRLCQRIAGANGLCPRHTELENLDMRRNIALDLWDEIEYLAAHGTDVRELEERLQDAYDRGDLTRHWFVRLGLRLILLEIGFPGEEDAPPAEPQNELEAFAQDPQSVHRAPVSEQTNRGLDVLLAAPVPSGQDTLAEIEAAWGNSQHTRRLLRDMKRWYKQSTCRDIGDKLYRRALDGLWVLVKASEFRTELVKRLQEEAEDAHKKCCDGHITRLVNVMVGFDDRFSPPVSVAELVQQRMSAIAGRDVSVEEKALEAWMVLEELAVPDVERMAWIDAF